MVFPTAQYQKWFSLQEEEIRKQFSQFLAFQSISTDPEHKNDCLDAAEWLLVFLRRMGMEAELLPSSGLPVVFAKKSAPEERTQSVLLYQHYDVQPVDPVALWTSDPFQPRWEEGKVFARGASDNKGQCFLTITALRALFEMEGSLPLHIKLFIEGEEESGSRGTAEVIQREKKRLKSDYLCVMDFDLPAPDVPSVVLGYRGLVAFEIECKNADTDLHSGTHGGMVLNPIHVLSSVIHRFWDSRGKVAIPHFYDGIEPLSEEERAKIDFALDETEYKKIHGIGTLCREEGFCTKESGGLRPTVEINGIWGGYTSAGFKTVLPSTACAKLSCRLVPGQDPDKIIRCLDLFLQENVPSGIRIKLKAYSGARAFRTPLDSPLIRTVGSSLEDVFHKPCRYTLCGGSVPIIQELASASQGEVALFGFALATDNIHAPNEHFRWECFKKGFLSMAQIVWRLAQEESKI